MLLDYQYRVPGSKPVGDFVIDSSFHPFVVDQMSARDSRGHVKQYLCPLGGSAALRELNLVHKKEPESF